MVKNCRCGRPPVERVLIAGLLSWWTCPVCYRSVSIDGFDTLTWFSEDEWNAAQSSKAVDKKGLFENTEKLGIGAVYGRSIVN